MQACEPIDVHSRSRSAHNARFFERLCFRSFVAGLLVWERGSSIFGGQRWAACVLFLWMEFYLSLLASVKTLCQTYSWLELHALISFLFWAV